MNWTDQPAADLPMSMSRRHPMQNIRILTAFLVTLYGVLPVLMTGVLAVDIARDLNFGIAQLGAAVSAGFAASAVASSPAGYLIQKLGGASSMRLAAFMSAVSLAGIGTLAQSWGTLVIFLVIAGTANAIAQPAAHQVLATDVHPGSQGVAFGIKDAAKPFATFLGGLSIPVIALGVGWRWAFISAAAVACLTGLLLKLGRETRVKVAQEEVRPLRLLPLVFLAVGVGLASASANALIAFFIVSAVDRGVEHSIAGILVSVASVLAVGVRIWAGHRADLRAELHLRAVTLMLLTGAAGMLLIALTQGWVFVVGSCLAFAAGLGWLGVFNFAVVSMNPGLVARATGITGTGSFLGATFGPAGFGLVAEAVSFKVAWLLAAGVMVMAGAVMEGVRLLER